MENILIDGGVPASVYQDRHTIHKRGDDFWSIEEELAGRQEPTQVGAAVEALGIKPIFARSPQAKGRVERLFNTLQDRLVAELRLAGIKELAAGNEFLPGFITRFNRDFAVCAQESVSTWRKAPAAAERERILSLCYRLVVGNDNAVRLEGMSTSRRGPRGAAMPKPRWSYASCWTGVGEYITRAR